MSPQGKRVTWTEKDGTVTLEMTYGDWQALLVIFGMAFGGVNDRVMRNEILRFINELNRTNSGFTPYEIPEEIPA